MSTDQVFIRACKKLSVPHVPIWIMRQAGRYMKEYRAVREKVDFLELCKNPELVKEVTLTAANMLGVDAAIIFADILLISEPLGFQLDFLKGEGPRIHNPFRHNRDLKRLTLNAAEKELAYVGQAIEKTRQALPDQKALIGFAGAPFTVASYLIEGGSSKNFEHTKILMKSDADTWNSFLDYITQMTFSYLRMQIEAGANAIQLFDSWVGLLNRNDYKDLVFPHIKNLVTQLKSAFPDIPLIYFGTNTYHLLDIINKLHADVIGIDSRINLSEVSVMLKDKALQGNLDPVTLLCEQSIIKTETVKILKEMHDRSGYIFNLGHGILPNTPFENAKFLVDTVHAYQK
ncbi:MAG: uroporphyrinogen decarboxylase [Bdellovibrionales bacterium]|nr:uroporphyrinogen decarboxylase [Bdellovibrionales bacterium]